LTGPGCVSGETPPAHGTQHDRPTTTSTVAVRRRRRWVALTEVIGTFAVALGTAWAVYHEWGFIRPGLDILTGSTDPTWALAAVGTECLSMVAFSLLQACLLRAAGAHLTLPWLLSTAYTANAIAISIPVIGSGMATAYDYRQLRSQRVDPNVARATLALGGAISTAGLAVVIALAALISGNPVAAVGGSATGVAAVAGVLVAPRFSKSARCQPFLARCTMIAQKVVHRPRGDPRQLANSATDLLNRMWLRPSTLVAGLGWGTLNWLTDACCLILAIKAIGAPVPWTSVLLAWGAGTSAGSFSPTPDGIGVVEVTMTAALVAAGLRPPDAIAAVLLYRIVSFKAVITIIWFTQRTLGRRWLQRAVQRV
jgi:putative heme transporter